MKKIIFSFLITILSFTYLNVSAIDQCTTSEMNRLKELANNVQFKPNYEIEPHEETSGDGQVYKSVSLVYNIDILNFDRDLRIKFEDLNGDEREQETVTYQMANIGGLSEGSKIKFSIYAYTLNLCTNELLKTVTVELPKYNDYYYYNKEKCLTAPNFKYCQEFYDTDGIEFSTIDKEYDSYANVSSNNEPKEDSNINLYLIILISAVVLIAIVSIIIIVKKRKNRDDL